MFNNVFTKKFSKDVGIFVLQDRSNLIFLHYKRNICIFIANNSENTKTYKEENLNHHNFITERWILLTIDYIFSQTFKIYPFILMKIWSYFIYCFMTWFPHPRNTQTHTQTHTHTHTQSHMHAHPTGIFPFKKCAYIQPKHKDVE